MPETVAIIDYGSGNLMSAQKAFQRSCIETGISAKIIVTSDPDSVRCADRIVLPGVGAFGDCRAGLMAVTGMNETINERVLADGVPFLGICVGMQLMAKRGFEKGNEAGLGWINGDVRRIAPNDKALKIPHMGWNTLDIVQDHPLLAEIETGENGLHAYFVHSYHLAVTEKNQLLATTDYGGPVTAIVCQDNAVGTQFHPEKSQALGLKFIANFLGWKP